MLSHRALLCRRCGCRCGHDGRRLGERYHGTDANPASVTIVVGGENLAIVAVLAVLVVLVVVLACDTNRS